MKPEEMIAVAVRLFAIALAIFSMRELSAVIWSLDSYYGEDAKFAVYVIGTITLLVALLLWRFPLTVSKFIYSKSSDDHLVSPIGVRNLYNLGFVILGFFILIKTGVRTQNLLI